MFDSNKYMNIPYSDKGRTWQGCDCWGLVRLVLWEERNIKIPSYEADYKSSRTWGEISAAVDKYRSEWIEVKTPKSLDLVVLHCRALKTHIGIMIDQINMLNMLDGSNVSVEKLNHPIWAVRGKEFYRHKSLCK